MKDTPRAGEVLVKLSQYRDETALSDEYMTVTQASNHLYRDMLAILEGLEIDIEATEKHIRNTRLTGDELERHILSANLEADDRKDVLDDVRTKLAEYLGVEQEGL